MFGVSGVRLCVLSSALLVAAGLASAQSKIAVINLQRAVLDSAEIKKASAQMEAKYKPRQQKIEELQKDLQSIQQQLQNSAGKLTPQAEADLNVRGQRKQKELQRESDDLQSDVDRERNDILARSTQKMQEIVRKIAEEKGIDLVVDAQTTVYFKPALEITNDALAAYDKAYPAK